MRMTNLIKLAIIGILGATVACSVSPEMDESMARTTENALDLKQKAALPSEPIPDDVVRVKNDIWLGDTSNVEFEGQPVPAYLETKDGITFSSVNCISILLLLYFWKQYKFPIYKLSYKSRLDLYTICNNILCWCN